jgi:excisionase family DNA binding protein
VNRLLTVEDAAALLRVSPRTLYNMRYRGETPGTLGVKIGGLVRFDEAVLEGWLRQLQESGGRRCC